MAAYLPEIRSIVRAVLHDDGIEIAWETRFDDVTGWDSMNLISVVVEVECRFDVRFEPADIECVASVGDLAEMIAAKRAVIVA